MHSEAAVERFEVAVQEAKAEGGTIECGGKVCCCAVEIEEVKCAVEIERAVEFDQPGDYEMVLCSSCRELTGLVTSWNQP